MLHLIKVIASEEPSEDTVLNLEAQFYSGFERVTLGFHVAYSRALEPGFYLARFQMNPRVCFARMEAAVIDDVIPLTIEGL